MSDEDLINKISEIWVENGGDSNGLLYCLQKILNKIKDLEDKK